MRIITVSRQFGSGGRELGKRLPDVPGWDCFRRANWMDRSKKVLDKYGSGSAAGRDHPKGNFAFKRETMSTTGKYKYETHCHTAPVSGCAKASPEDTVRFYKRLGYDGIFVSDHFFRGNCAIPRDLPWEEWVRRYCLGYYSAKEEGDRIGLQVFFSWEESIDGDDWLVYGLPPEWEDLESRAKVASRDDSQIPSTELAAKTRSLLVSVTGVTAVFYRPNPEAGKK